MRTPIYLVIDTQYVGPEMIIDSFLDEEYAVDFIVEGIKNGYLSENTVEIIFMEARG